MAESIVVYFPKTSWKDIALVLDEVARPAQGITVHSTWVYPPEQDNHVLLYDYSDIFEEYEDDHVRQVKSAFGALPQTTLCIELRGSKGIIAFDTAEILTVLFLQRFRGMADDLIGQLWSLEKILEAQNLQADERKFLGWYRQRILRERHKPAG